MQALNSSTLVCTLQPQRGVGSQATSGPNKSGVLVDSPLRSYTRREEKNKNGQLMMKENRETHG